MVYKVTHCFSTFNLLLFKIKMAAPELLKTGQVPSIPTYTLDFALNNSNGVSLALLTHQ